MDQKPIKVQPSAVAPLVSNFLRQLGILIGGSATIIVLLRNFFGSGDLNEAIAWVSSQDFVAVLAALTFVGSSLASLWKTVHNEWIKRTLTAQVPDRLASIEAHGIGKPLLKLLAALGLISIAGCATWSGTPAQKLFEARAYWNLMKGVGVDYAEGPTARADVVLAIVRIRDVAKPSEDYVDAYVACRVRGGDEVRLLGRVDAVPCAQFSFSATSMSSAAIALRSAAAQLLSQTERTAR